VNHITGTIRLLLSLRCVRSAILGSCRLFWLPTDVSIMKCPNFCPFNLGLCATTRNCSTYDENNVHYLGSFCQPDHDVSWFSCRAEID